MLPRCSQASAPAEGGARTGPAEATPRPAARTAQAPARDAGRRAAERASRIFGKTQISLRGKPACRIDYAYAGRAADNLLWEEPCGAVTARLVTQQDLEGFGKWGRLDGFAQKFVKTLPRGQLLYVEDCFSASVYPVGTDGMAYEVPVAD